jgi:hypothetical protein
MFKLGDVELYGSSQPISALLPFFGFFQSFGPGTKPKLKTNVAHPLMSYLE